MSTTTEMKPCPFCGTKPELVWRDGAQAIVSGGFVVCDGCGISTKITDTRNEAVELWNNRRSAAQGEQIDETQLAIELARVAHNHVENGEMRHDVGIALLEVVLKHTAPAPSNKEMEDAVLDAMAHGTGIVRIDPMSIYQQPEQDAPSKEDAYARDLAMSIWKRHYREVAPHFELLPDLLGVLTQIDNMVAGIPNQQTAPSKAGEWTDEQIMCKWFEATHAYDCLVPEAICKFARALLSSAPAQAQSEKGGEA